MDAETLRAGLQGLPLGEIYYYDQIGSTNDAAAELLRSGGPHLSLLVADEQTRGRGRSGRGWFTPPGAALAFSMLFYARGRRADQLPLFAGLGALAVCRALENCCGLQAEIKWPNDVLLSKAKVAGVLPEAHWEGDRLAGVILGIGLNVSPGALPPQGELQFPATCVEAALGRPLARLDLLVEIVAALLKDLEALGSPEFLGEWRSRLAFRGRTVQLIRADQAILEGRIAGLSADGRLQLRDRSGQVHQVRAGDLRLRPAATG